MGWSSGSIIGPDIYNKVRPLIAEDKRQEVAFFIYDIMCDYDADAWDGTTQLEKDAEVNQEEDDE